MKTIIIEDEKPAARRLERLLGRLDVEVSKMLHSVEESVQWFRNNEHPDLIFLDIQLSDGLSFEIFDMVSVQSAVIFTTAYDEYALQAFKLNSIDYLLKPIDEEELESALKKYRDIRTSPQKVTVDLQEIKKLMTGSKEKDYKKRFTIRVGQHLRIINAEEVECFYSENKGTYVVTSDGRNYLMETTLENLESDLEPSVFFRVSRKFFININFVKDIVSYTNSRLQIKLNRYDGQDIIVSRERVQEFKSWLQ